MSKTEKTLRGILVACIIAVLAMVVAPVEPAAARTVSDPGTPPAPTEMRGWRLERIWARQQRAHDRMGFLFDHVEQRINRAQELIDRAASNGKDISALQSALDAFTRAVQDARPSYESAKGIIASHAGFDANGTVTDVEIAATTVKDMAEKLEAVRSTLLPAMRDLRDALRAFRDANRPG